MNRSALPEWVARHPVLWGVTSGAMAALIGLANFGFMIWPIALAIGIVFGAANGWVWRRGGPAHQWRVRLLARFPRRP